VQPISRVISPPPNKQTTAAMPQFTAIATCALCKLNRRRTDLQASEPSRGIRDDAVTRIRLELHQQNPSHAITTTTVPPAQRHAPVSPRPPRTRERRYVDPAGATTDWTGIPDRLRTQILQSWL
jgi:hypothetical protein